MESLHCSLKLLTYHYRSCKVSSIFIHYSNHRAIINWQMESPFYTIFLSNSWDIHVWLFDIQFNIIFKRALDVQQRFKKFQPLNFIWNCVIFKTNRIGTKKHNLLKLRKTAKSAKCFKNWKKVIQSKMLLTVYFTKTVVNFLEH